MMTDTEELKRWNERYARGDYHFGTEPNAFLAAQRRRLTPGQAALAIADGEGRNGVWLALQGLDVTTIDFAPAGVEKARRLAARSGVRMQIECADVATWDWGEPRFDVVVGIFIQFAPPPARAALFRRMKAVLKPGGLVFLEGYRPQQLQYRTGGPSAVENLDTAPMLREAFADMAILHLVEYDAEIAEGSRHNGMSALVDLVAQKP